MTVDTGRPRRSGNGTSLRGRPQGTGDVPGGGSGSAPASEIAWSRVGRDRFEVTRSGRTLGFIDVEGGVFVALAGRRYDRAVEASQTLRFADAVRALEDRY